MRQPKADPDRHAQVDLMENERAADVPLLMAVTVDCADLNDVATPTRHPRRRIVIIDKAQPIRRPDMGGQMALGLDCLAAIDRSLLPLLRSLPVALAKILLAIVALVASERVSGRRHE